MERLLMRAQEVAYRFSLLVCGHPEDAEDVMQDALLKTYRYVSRITEPEAFRTWLYTTVRNACLMKRRRHVGEPAHFVSLAQGVPATDDKAAPVDVADPSRLADQTLIDKWIDGRLNDALKALPPSYRMIVVMREMDGLSTREVARSRTAVASVRYGADSPLAATTRSGGLAAGSLRRVAGHLRAG
jgi:RNA polymerase sigma-70 factor, ECF subfamily